MQDRSDIYAANLMTPDEAAVFIGRTKATLANWRKSGSDGPPFSVIGSKVFYHKADVTEWAKSGKTRRALGAGCAPKDDFSSLRRLSEIAALQYKLSAEAAHLISTLTALAAAEDQ